MNSITTFVLNLLALSFFAAGVVVSVMLIVYLVKNRGRV